MSYKIGVVGYSGAKFDKDEAFEMLLEALQMFRHTEDVNLELVSGLTDLGIPALAYRIAEEWGWKTTGIACSKAKEYDCFQVDNIIIVGDNWGNESEEFLHYIDVLVRVGGGKQSLAEVTRAKELGITVFEYELPEIK